MKAKDVLIYFPSDGKATNSLGLWFCIVCKTRRNYSTKSIEKQIRKLVQRRLVEYSHTAFGLKCYRRL